MGQVPDLLTVEEAAKVLRIGRTMAYQLAQTSLATNGAEGIPCRRVGRLLRVPSSELAALVGGPITWPPGDVADAVVNVDARREEPTPASPRPSSPTRRRSPRRATQQTSLPFS
jgi:excisionase family DNA binding protein